LSILLPELHLSMLLPELHLSMLSPQFHLIILLSELHLSLLLPELHLSMLLPDCLAFSGCVLAASTCNFHAICPTCTSASHVHPQSCCHVSQVACAAYCLHQYTSSKSVKWRYLFIAGRAYCKEHKKGPIYLRCKSSQENYKTQYTRLKISFAQAQCKCLLKYIQK
jgi:hypothetical protein